MELSLREWIMVASFVLMAAILGHALWLRWRSRRSRLRLEIEPAAGTGPQVDDLDLLRGELPNGGARVVAKTDDPRGSRSGARQNADPPPVLLDTVDDARRVEPSIGGDDDDDAAAEAPRERAATSQARAQEADADDEPSGGNERGGRQELIVMQVLARDPEGFEMSALMTRATDAGMKFGDFNIFHRYKDGRPARKGIEYSMANAMEPGVFDLSAAADARTRGVAFFMQLPVPSEPMEVFDDMLRVAQDIAHALDGEVRDERHGVMTVQTIEHCRERIREFTRRQQIPG